MIPVSYRVLNRINKDLIWSLYNLKSKKILPRSLFILSFDCDTEDDISVVWDVHAKLQKMGITPVYAVPGELLKKGENVYKKIYDSGAEFINHGGREHTYFDAVNQRHASCFFYDQQSLETVKEDILLGHLTLQEVLGVTPNGWRTPHFGTFQQSSHLEFLYGVLRSLNYMYSTSTSPIMAYRHGPVYKTQGMIEVPVTGVHSLPFNIMDTWAYFGAPDRRKSSQDYLQAAKLLANFANNHPVLINIYGDPSHIYDKPEFFESMALLVQAANNINYTQLLERKYENVRNF